MCWPLSPWEGVCRFAASTCSWKGRKRAWFQLVGPSAVAMACTLPLESEMEAAAGTCSHPPWRSCGQYPATWEGHRRRSSYDSPVPLLMHPYQWHLVSLAGPGFFLHPLWWHTTHSPLRLSPCSPPQFSPLIWPPKPKPQHPAATHTSNERLRLGSSELQH